MHKGRLKTDFKGNRSIPNRGTSRPENVSAKQRKQYAHNAPAPVLGAKREGNDNDRPPVGWIRRKLDLK